MREHVPDGARALSFVRCEQVIEFKHAGEQRQESSPRWCVGNSGDRGMEPTQGQELPVVEEVTPGREGIAHGLARVVADLQGERGQQDLTALGFLPESCRTFPVCRVVVGCGR